MSIMPNSAIKASILKAIIWGRMHKGMHFGMWFRFFSNEIRKRSRPKVVNAYRNSFGHL